MSRPNALFILVTLLASATHSVVAQTAASLAYTPVSTSCASPSIRSAGTTQQALHSQEAQYISTRNSAVLPKSWSAYYSNVNAHAKAHGITLPSYVQQLLAGGSTPAHMNVGIAVSGGGYRASTFGAGVFNAFDGRNRTSVSAGTGGLLQGLSYMTGLSGGSWLITSMTQANFPTIPQLVLGTGSYNTAGDTTAWGGWQASYGLIEATSNPFTEGDYILEIVDEIKGKHAAGYTVTITDLWARILARHFVNGTTDANFFNDDIAHGAGYLWSDVMRVPSLAQHAQPFPIVIADCISENQNRSNFASGGYGVSLTNPIYEFTPYEFGSYDPSLASFIPTKNLGSSPGTCVTGFDQSSFIDAVSSNLFNAADSDVGSALSDALAAAFPQPGVDSLTSEIPNPFKGVASHTFMDTAEDMLYLVDAGEDGQEIPLQPLLVKARGVNVIIAVDASGDSNDYADGSSLVTAAQRAALIPGTYPFPSVPSSSDDFVSQGLNTAPAFFGCNDNTGAPLIIYIANGAAPSGQDEVTNTSTWQLTYEDDELSAMLDQTFTMATQGKASGSQKDPQWPSCLACAVVDRARAASGTARSGVCASCMQRYCWS